MGAKKGAKFSNDPDIFMLRWEGAQSNIPGAMRPGLF